MRLRRPQPLRLLVDGEGPITVYLEPEGNEVDVAKDDWLMMRTI